VIESYREALIDLAYLVSAVALVFGLKRMSAPRTARSGNQISAAALLLAVARLRRTTARIPPLLAR